MNVLSAFGGIFIDVVGCERAAIVGAVLWTLSSSVSGFVPEVGYLWSVCCCLNCTAGVLVSLSLNTGYLPSLCDGNKDKMSMWSMMLRSTWDIGQAVGLLVGMLLAVEQLPLWSLYGMYGLGNGGLMVVMCFLLQRGRPLREVKSVRQQATLYLAVSKDVIATKLFWGLWFDAAALVTGGFFVIANVGVLFRVKNASVDQVEFGRKVFVYGLSACGLISAVPGLFVKWLGFKRGVLVGQMLGLGLSIAFILLVMYGSLTDQYVAVTLFTLWRIWGFAGINAAIISLLGAQYPTGLGFVFGLLYTIAGVLSLALGGYLTHFVNQDPSRFIPVTIGFIVWGILGNLVGSGAIAGQDVGASSKSTAEGASCDERSHLVNEDV